MAATAASLDRFGIGFDSAGSERVLLEVVVVRVLGDVVARRVNGRWFVYAGIKGRRMVEEYQRRQCLSVDFNDAIYLACANRIGNWPRTRRILFLFS